MKHACSSHFDDFHTEEVMNMVHDDEKGNNRVAHYNGKFKKEKFWTVKPDEILEPSLLGIQPEPPSWPERDEILRLSFERKVKSVGIPLSIRMIKEKLKLQAGVKEVGESETELIQCSVKKTFSSMLFILQQLQNHALETRERLCCEDLQGVMVKLQREMDASFVWLFQQVFSETPTLMVSVMVLLANFSVLSVSNNSVKDATPMSMMTTVLSLSKQKHPQVDSEVDQDECVKEELTEEEEMLWSSMVKEASMLQQKECGAEILDHETMRFSVAPVSVKLEGDQYEEYLKTEAYYQKLILLTPHNSLLLSNYAQFLFLVLHDIDG